MSELQSTSRTRTSRSREAVFGVINTNPVFRQVRLTNNNFTPDIQTVISEEVNPDRQISDLILVGQNANGDMGGEFSFLTFDDDLEEALQSLWVSQPNITVLTADTEINDISATAVTVAAGGANFRTGHLTLMQGNAIPANNRLARVLSSTATVITYGAATFTAQAAVNAGTSLRVVGLEGAAGDLVATTVGGNAITSTALNFTTMDIQPGDWVRIGDGTSQNSFNTAASNGWERVSAVAANRLSFDIVPAGFASDAGTGKTIRIFFGDRLRNGTTKMSTTIERQWLDHTPVSFEYFTGQTIDTMSIDLEAKSIAKINRTFKGSTAQLLTSRVAGATDIPATTTDVMNTSSNVGDIAINGTTVTGPNFVMKATIEMANNLDNQDAIMSVGAVGLSNGEFNCSGELNMYFGSPLYYQMLLTSALFGLNIRMADGSANRQGYMFDMPACEFASGAPTIPGKNQSVMFNPRYQARRHATLGYTIGVNRFWFTP